MSAQSRAMEIPAKEGMLHLQGFKFGMKSWRRAWAMLFPPSSFGIGRVELYSLRDSGGSGPGPTQAKQGLKEADKRVIRLDDCVSVCAAPEEACPRDCTAFYLSTTQRTYALAAPSADAWVTVICQLAFQKNDRDPELKSRTLNKETPMSENELYSTWSSHTPAEPGEFRVTVGQTKAADRCKLSGSYLLSVSREALTLRDTHAAQPLYRWPYQLLRRFGHDKDMVSFEAGRRCDSGEGQFTLLSHSAAQIYRAIEEGIRHQSSPEPKTNPRTSPPSGRAPPDRGIRALPPRNAALPSLPSRLPQNQPTPPLVESGTQLNSSLLLPLQNRSPSGGHLMQHSLPSICAKEDEDEEEEESHMGEEERLRLNCLEDRMSPLYRNMKSLMERECMSQEVQAKLGTPDQECVYTLVSFHQVRGRGCSTGGRPVPPGANPSPPSISTSSKIPQDFKQKLSSLLSKDLAKAPPLLPSRQEY
ncbi:hypothetical protein AAFF_G00013500 [Aldrovandia affinis]|uniref:IRS-type PTB domain-containing protein n=1 Tax=Aldrovandia affinis TaxID=143900 RepID=A0AAD7S690_9TELE|nr:hypothetical protein AAFF_G00013500 [Aldrovandia affinis]